MNRHQIKRGARLTGALVLGYVVLACSALTAFAAARDPLTASDATGQMRTFTADGKLNTSGPFFQSLGTNGRTCASCHRVDSAWSITPAELQNRFNSSNGTDPVFRTVDGSNAPNADVSTVDARRKAYTMLLTKGLIRIGMPLPATAEFTLVGVDDPYHYASAAQLSLFRRPLPSTNLRFLTGIMWDVRNTHSPFLPPMDAGANIDDLAASLNAQINDAVLTHAEGTAPPTADQQKQILNFELGLITAQVFDNDAGNLNSDDALGGPRALANQQFYVGVNDVLGLDPSGAAFGASAMPMYDAWLNDPNPKRASIARGAALFGSKPIAITGVGGLNDALGMPTIAGTCTTCHDTPNIGNHSVALPIDIGLTDASRRTADMPLYTLQNKTTGATRQTTDPGRALLTGKWADIGKFKGPVLRGLAARAPYFHNGMAASLDDVITFYNSRFNVGITRQERADLIAFLNAL